MDFIINLISLIINFGLVFITIITVPTLFREFDDKLTHAWLNLSDLTNNGKTKIREYSLSTIQFIYEKNGKPSLKKFLYVGLILNSLYGIALYSSFPLPNVSKELQLKGLSFFIIMGIATMVMFEYFAYKISISAIKKYIKSNEIKFIVKGIIKIFFFMYILPLVLSVLATLFNQQLGIFMTGIFYFSPSGVLSFMMNIFTQPIKDGKNYLLLLPAISTIAPIIYFIAWEFFYVVIRKMILPLIEAVDFLIKYVRGEYKNVIAKIVIWAILLLALVLQVIQLIFK
jgi:hypothetical protein